MTWDQLQSTYDRVAGKYETRFLDELEGKPRDRELLERFALSTSDPVVEIGCGPGQIGAFVRARGRHVVGVDLSEAMARLARSRLDAGGRILLSAHEGHNEVERDEFLEEHVPFIATLFELDELVAAMTTAGFDITIAERRPSYDSESGTVRLYVEAERH